MASLLDASQSYLDQQAKLSQELKAAFFALTEARYALGAGKVGQAQYPAAMQASQRVCAAAEEGVASFSLQQAGSAPGNVHEDSTQAASRQAEFTGVLASLAEQFQCQTVQDEPSAQCTQQPENRQDPLRWFGVMVPAALRQAQRRFAAALEECVALSGQQAAVLASLSALGSMRQDTSEVDSSVA